MLTAVDARKMTDKILDPVPKSPEFQAIMERIDSEIRSAINNGCESLELKGYCLPVYNNYKYPKGINCMAINRDTFWVPYVKAELENLGFKVYSTITYNTYIVRW